jgi:hypothetical protein
MIVRLLLLLLIVVAVLALLGRWGRPRVPPKDRSTAVEAARKCPDCGAWVLAGERCPCTDGRLG